MRHKVTSLSLQLARLCLLVSVMAFTLVSYPNTNTALAKPPKQKTRQQPPFGLTNWGASQAAAWVTVTPSQQFTAVLSFNVSISRAGETDNPVHEHRTVFPALQFRPQEQRGFSIGYGLPPPEFTPGLYNVQIEWQMLVEEIGGTISSFTGAVDLPLDVRPSGDYLLYLPLLTN